MQFVESIISIHETPCPPVTCAYPELVSRALHPSTITARHPLLNLAIAFVTLPNSCSESPFRSDQDKWKAPWPSRIATNSFSFSTA